MGKLKKKKDKRKKLLVEGPTKRITIGGIIGEGPHFSRIIPFERRIGKTKLNKVSTPLNPNLARNYGVNLSGNKKECQAWCTFNGVNGKRTSAKFNLKVWYEA